MKALVLRLPKFWVRIALRYLERLNALRGDVRLRRAGITDEWWDTITNDRIFIDAMNESDVLTSVGS